MGRASAPPTGTRRGVSPLVVAGLAMTVLLGIALGVGAYTFVYAKGYSYLTNDPAACANCHVMGDYYAGWMKSPHHTVAVCNDCHTPHNLAGKYYVKARNGFWHSFYFTTGRFPEPIRTTPANRKVTEAACRSCHAPIVDELIGPHAGPDALSCVRCHASVGHPH